jgi:sortase (surface protein transpeptidase)
VVKEFSLDKLRFGDFVAVLDHDNRYGRTYRKGSITIGVVIHSDSPLAGHGPGMMTLMTCTSDKLIPVLNNNANLGVVRGIGRFA